MRRLICLFWMILAAPLAALDTDARAIMVVDQSTGQVLFAKNADEPLPPASMSKLMTLNMLFEALKSGRVSLDTEFNVSENAGSIGGSTMFLRVGSKVPVRDLLLGIIVQSGNDASVVVAENLAGSERTFAELMSKRAQELGMTGSRFANATGWPDPGQRMSMRDLVFLANRLMTVFPEYYGMFSQKEYTWDGVTQPNRNPLLGRIKGADGLKTGHTVEAGYGLVGSVKEGDRRIIFAFSGLQSKQARAQEAEKVANWALRQFASKELFEEDHVIAMGDVWLGSQAQVPMVADGKVNTLVPLAYGTVKMNVTYDSPIPAPITKGQEIGALIVKPETLSETRIPLYAGADVSEAGLVSRMKASAMILSGAYLGLGPLAK